MKNSNDTIGKRIRDLPACSAVSQPTAAPRAPYRKLIQTGITYEYTYIVNDITASCAWHLHTSISLQKMNLLALITAMQFVNYYRQFSIMKPSTEKS